MSRHTPVQRLRRFGRLGLATASAAALLAVSACTPEDSADEDAGVGSVATAAAEDAVSTPGTGTGAKGGAVTASSTSTKTSEPTKTKTKKKARSTRTKTSTASSTRSSDSDRRLYRVIRVVDGDTVKVDKNGGESVRVIGIDTPETVHPSKPVECGGRDASAAAKQLLEGKRVELVFDSSQGWRDKYGRLLAYIDIPGTGDFGETMIRKGHAEEYTYAKPYQRRPTYRWAERQARSGDRGIWGACTQSQTQDRPTSQPSSTPTSTPTQTPAPAPKPKPKPAPAPAPKTTAPAPTGGTSPGPGWTNDALTPGYTGCRQGYPGGKINGVYWWKPIAC